MSLFDSYERECDHTLNEATKKIVSIGVASGVSKDKITRDIEELLAQAEKSIENMRQMSQNARASEGYGVRIQQRVGHLERVKADFDRNLNVNRGRADLFAGSPSAGRTDWGRQDAMMRDGMNGHRARLEGATENLNRAHQMAEETNEIGVASLNDLRRQREQLLNAQGGMEHIEEKTSAARRVLGVMRRRVIGNKLILGFIILVLVAGNILIIYFRWIHRGGSNKSPKPAPVAPPPPPPTPVPAPAPIAAPIAPPIPPPVAAPIANPPTAFKRDPEFAAFMK